MRFEWLVRPHNSGSSFALPQFLGLDVKVFETVLSLELSVSAGGSTVYPGVPARNPRVILVSLIPLPTPGLSVSIEDFSNAVHIFPLLPGPPHILSLKHGLYSATIQPSLTASDQGPGSLTLTQVPSCAALGRGVLHAQPCIPSEVTLFLLWAFAGPRRTTSSPSAQLSCFHLWDRPRQVSLPLHPPCPGVGDWFCSLTLCICPRSLMHGMVLGFSSARSSPLCPTVIPHWPRATQSMTAFTLPTPFICTISWLSAPSLPLGWMYFPCFCTPPVIYGCPYFLTLSFYNVLFILLFCMYLYGPHFLQYAGYKC